jgi:RNA-binding protein YhbY
MLVTHHLGKQGLTPGFIDLLEKTFKKNDLVKVVVLKSATRNRDELKEISNKICIELTKKIGRGFTARVIGFTIFIRKWRKIK